MKTCLHCKKPTKRKKYCSWECRYDIAARFQSFIQIPDDPSECWVWQGRLRVRGGYGTLQVANKETLAHRLSWQLKNGPIPKGMDILHSCDNPPCVNPDHLRPGTHLDNMREMYAKGRRKTACGERGGNSKLTEATVAAIRSEYQFRKVTLKMLSLKYGVSWATVQKIVAGQSWKHSANLQQTVTKLLTA
jgi:hypothetical protein